VRAEKDMPNAVGLGFEPVKGRRVPEIKGTLWVDRGSSELRVLDYEYVNVPISVRAPGLGIPSPDGKALFYHEPATNRLFVVDVRTTPSFSFGRPTPLPIEGTIHPLAQRNYDVTPDGRQLLVVVSATPRTAESGRTARQINVVLNWFEELKTRVPITK